MTQPKTLHEPRPNPRTREEEDAELLYRNAREREGYRLVRLRYRDFWGRQVFTWMKA